MSSPEYFIDTHPLDPATLEPVVPEGAEDLLQNDQSETTQEGCCGGGCCS